MLGIKIRKFIIVDGKLIMGLVENHVDLLQEVVGVGKISGGGYWEHNEEKWGKKVFFFGKSNTLSMEDSQRSN